MPEEKAKERTRQGEAFPAEQAFDRSYDPQKGWKATRVFEGDESYIQSLANSLVQSAPQYINVQIKPKPPGLATLTVTYDGIRDGSEPAAESDGQPTPDADSWSLTGSDYEKDLWSHSSIVSLAENHSGDYTWLRQNVALARKNNDWNDTIQSWNSVNFTNSATTLSLFKMFRDGVEAYTISQFVLKRQRGISHVAQGVVSVAYIGYQFTSGQMVAYEGLPSVLNFGLPSGGAWIKRTPSIEFDAITGKMSVSNEYWHADDWNTILYPSR